MNFDRQLRSTDPPAADQKTNYFRDRDKGGSTCVDLNTLYPALKVPIVPGDKKTDILPRSMMYAYELGTGNGSCRSFSLPPGVNDCDYDFTRYEVAVDVPGGRHYSFDLVPAGARFDPQRNVLVADGSILFAPSSPGPPPAGSRVYLRAPFKISKEADWERNFKLGGWADNFFPTWDGPGWRRNKVTGSLQKGTRAQPFTNIVQIFEELPRTLNNNKRYFAPWANTVDAYLVVEAEKVPDGTLLLRARIGNYSGDVESF